MAEETIVYRFNCKNRPVLIILRRCWLGVMCRSWEKRRDGKAGAILWADEHAQRQPLGTGLVHVGSQVGRRTKVRLLTMISWQDETVAGKCLETKRRRQLGEWTSIISNPSANFLSYWSQAHKDRH